MTFLNFRSRSSSEDDRLDQALNAWAKGDRHSEVVEESPRESHSEKSDFTADALDFHRWADETRRSDPAASGPVADTWNRVLRSTAQESPKGRRKVSTAHSTAHQAVSLSPPTSIGRSVRHYSTLAATIAIVFAVTIGGWFAMSQTRPGGTGRFAAVPATPETAQSQTCDVRPLTVDEVIAIVENPLSAVEPTWFATPAPRSGIPTENLAHNQDLLDLTDLQGMIVPPPMQAAYSVPEDATFEEASIAAQQYISCMETGTYGQIWALTEPTMIQYFILSPYPIHRDESMIRAFIEERIDQVPEMSGAMDSYAAANSDLAFTTNPRRGDSRIWLTDSPEILDYDKVVFVGMQALDGDGNVVYSDDWNATTVEGDSSRSNGTSLILVHSESTDNWYFVRWHAPRG